MDPCPDTSPAGICACYLCVTDCTIEDLGPCFILDPNGLPGCLRPGHYWLADPTQCIGCPYNPDPSCVPSSSSSGAPPSMCGGVPYNSMTHGCCNTAIFNKASSYCCNGAITLRSRSCCDTAGSYDPNTEQCCPGSPPLLIPVTATCDPLCNGVRYDSITQTCCNGSIVAGRNADCNLTPCTCDPVFNGNSMNGHCITDWDCLGDSSSPVLPFNGTCVSIVTGARVSPITISIANCCSRTFPPTACPPRP